MEQNESPLAQDQGRSSNSPPRQLSACPGRRDVFEALGLFASGESGAGGFAFQGAGIGAHVACHSELVLDFGNVASKLAQVTGLSLARLWPCGKYAQARAASRAKAPAAPGGGVMAIRPVVSPLMFHADRCEDCETHHAERTKQVIAAMTEETTRLPRAMTSCASAGS